MKLFIKKNKPLDINVAPLIDIVFLLLIFFMLASEFTDFKTIDLVSPIESNTNIEITKLPIIINLSETGTIHVNSETIEINNLSNFLNTTLIENSSKKVVINTDENTKINLLIDIIDIVRDLGIDKIALETKVIK
ncbi:MAG: hypothetical protein CMJ14_00015 [Pelagibacterales bacterium]|nr:hypothetical protein [Pelagibacterales bacterium]|tara:strand:- start:1315 stop:1719 length:405 start_codon:yes stop_codon:yes gene_type:complete